MPPRKRQTGIIYCRESNVRRRARTGEIRRDLSRSLDEQEEVCRRDCERNDIDVIDVIREPKGASIYSPGKRTKWQDALDRLAAEHIDFLVTTESSRNHRDLAFYIMLREVCRPIGTKLMYNGRIFDLNDPDDAFITAIDAAGDEREAGKTHNRVMRATRSRAAAGRPHGRHTYGYARVYNQTTGEFIEQIPDPTTAPVVQRIYSMLADGASPTGVAKALTRDGIAPPATADVWYPAAVKAIGTNRAYLGERLMNGKVVVQNAWPPIIAEDLWWAVHGRLTKPAAKVIDSTAKTLLSGIATCGVCGGKLYHTQGRARLTAEGRRPSRRYRCKNRQCLARNADALDAYVTEYLLTMAEDDDRIGPQGEDPRLAEAVRQATGLQNRLDAFTRSASEPDGITPERLAIIERDLLPKIAAAERRRDALQARRALDALRGGNPRQAWRQFTLAQQRRIVRETLTIVVHRAPNRSRMFDPELVDVAPIDADAE